MAMLTSRKIAALTVHIAHFDLLVSNKHSCKVGNQWQSINMCIMTRSDTGYVLISLFS